MKKSAVKAAPEKLKSLRLQAEIISRANALLEPELREKACIYDVEKRIKVSKKLARWSEQLQASAKEINRLVASDINLPEISDVDQNADELRSIKATIDACLDPELREDVAGLNSDQRWNIINRFRLWADQLARTILDLRRAEADHDKTRLGLN